MNAHSGTTRINVGRTDGHLIARGANGQDRTAQAPRSTQNNPEKSRHQVGPQTQLPSGNCWWSYHPPDGQQLPNGVMA
eukprot:6784608-Alexandrium_andersonii.AAC.1